MRAMEREVGTWIVPFLFLFFLPLRWISANFEGDALHAFKKAVTDDPNQVLQSWDPTLADPCTWFHITCDNENNVMRVDLGNAQLSGSMVADFSKLKKLQYLELYSNNISGSIPTEFWNLTSLVSLDLYNNRLTGHIPETLGKMQKLRFLRINNNSLDGCIPRSLTTINTLELLDLSNNKLCGPIPEDGSFSKFGPISYENNPSFCGSFTGISCSGTPCP